MNKVLKMKTEEWMSLERKTFEQRAIAEKFYEEEMMVQITKEYIANNKDIIKEKVKYMVVSVGTSYEPIVLNLSLVKPEKIHFLYTEQSEPIIDKVADFCGLKFSQVEKSKVNETESLDVYREIKNCYLKWRKPQKLYIDFTGGTKAMSTAAAMAGSIIRVQMIYCGSNQYMQDFRKPFPGSERLFLIKNPMSVFGDLEIEKAFSLFREYNYAGVCEKLLQLKENVPDPLKRQELSFVYQLALAYECWDALDFVEAYRNMKKLNEEIERDMQTNATFLLVDKAKNLKIQEIILLSLSELPDLVRNKRQMDILSQKQYIHPLMFTMYQSAYVREAQEKYDMSTLLYYRLLEMIEQRQLSKYRLYVSKMDYQNINWEGIDSPEEKQRLLRESVAEIKKAVFGKCNNSFLPEQVSLLEGFIILAALGDQIMQEGGNSIEKLKRIRAMVSLRNNSIFAHGLAPVKKTDFIKFKNFVEELFQQLCGIEGIPFELYFQQIKWITPVGEMEE